MFFNKKNKFDHLTDDFQVIFIADTHNALDITELEELNQQNISNLKAIIFLGDVGEHDFEKLNTMSWYRNPDLIKLGVLGNHDGFSIYDYNNIVNLEKTNTVFINDISFCGIGGSLKYSNSNAPLLTAEESIEKFDKLPKADILITHDGPEDKHLESSHRGLPGISQYIKKNRPSYHFFGHRHNPKTTIIKHTESICEYRVSLYNFSKKGATRQWSSFENYTVRMKQWIHNNF